MSAGMMPALDLPGLMMPGQFGPMIRVRLPVFTAYAHALAESWTGTPSVITTARPIFASIASMIASLVNAGGTNRTLTSAPVLSIASTTEPNTGCWLPSKSTVLPALRAFTPPTMVVPEASIRRVCLVPSDPVMPCTMTRDFSVRKIAIGFSDSRVVEGGEGQFGGLVGAGVHGLGLDHQRVVRLVQDPPALLHVVPVQPDHQWLGLLLAEHLQRADDAVGHRVAGGDPAEHVHEHRADVRVGQDDVQPVGHHLRGRAAADVQEVGRLDPAVRLPGV